MAGCSIFQFNKSDISSRAIAGGIRLVFVVQKTKWAAQIKKLASS
jgi:hypothetical protein